MDSEELARGEVLMIFLHAAWLYKPVWFLFHWSTHGCIYSIHTIYVVVNIQDSKLSKHNHAKW